MISLLYLFTNFISRLPIACPSWFSHIYIEIDRERERERAPKYPILSYALTQMCWHHLEQKNMSLKNITSLFMKNIITNTDYEKHNHCYHIYICIEEIEIEKE